MNCSLSRCVTTLAVLFGTLHYPITFTIGLGLGLGLGPSRTSSPARVAFALPSVCAAAYHRYCPFTRHHRHRRRRQQQQQQQRRRPMAFINEPAPAAAAAAEVAEAAAAAAAAVAAQDPQQRAPIGGDASPSPEVAAEAVHTRPAGCVTGGGLERDAEHMRRALVLAAKGLGRTRPNPAVGCVIVDTEGQVVGEGFHPKAGEPHAEVWAIRQAGERAKGGTAYVTLEPCNHYGRTPPCTAALLNSGVSRVVAGMVDPDPRTAGSGLRRLADQGLDVTVGVEGAACQAVNCAFVHRVSEKSCYGVLHCSLDGPDSLELEDNACETELTIPPDRHSYNEYDAIVVEGRSGVVKLTACLQAIPPTALRVVLVSSGEGIEEELGPVKESALWTDLPGHTIIVAARSSNEKDDGDAPGPVRAMLRATGVTIVDFVHEQPASRESHGTSAEAEAGAAEAGAAAAGKGAAAAATAAEAGTSATEAEAAATAEGVTQACTAATVAEADAAAGDAAVGDAAAGDAAVGDAAAGDAATGDEAAGDAAAGDAAAGDAVAADAAVAGVAATTAVAKELYRRGLLSAVWEVGPATAAQALQGGHIQRALVRRRRPEGEESDGERSTQPTPPQGSSGGKGKEEKAALRAMSRLCGKEGVCVRRDGAVPREAGEKNFTEVLLPVAPFRKSA